MTKKDWDLLLELAVEHYKNIEDSREDVPAKELPEFEDIETQACGLVLKLKHHIKYIKEITYWQDYMDKDKALQYLAALSAPDIDKPDCECGFREILEAS